MRRNRILPIVLTIALSGWVCAQEPFRSGTTLVPVDVRVVDRDGMPVTDLTARDFTILEDKVPQTIVQFSTQAFTPEALAQPARARRAADAFERTSTNQRTFLIVLGRGRLQPPADGIDAMLHFVRDRLLPQDLVAVMAWNRATDFSSDHTHALAVLERFNERHVGLEFQIADWGRSLAAVYGNGRLPDFIQKNIDEVFGGPLARNQRTFGDARAAAAMQARTAVVANRLAGGRAMSPLEELSLDVAGQSLDEFLATQIQTQQDLTKLYFGIEYLRHLAGEKHLVFVTESGIGFRVMEEERTLARAAADARVAMDIIHTGGIFYRGPGSVGGGPLGPSGATKETVLTARNLAALTGGQFFANKLPKASMDADLIDQSARFSYVLGYAPASQNWDGRYRNIDIKVNRAGLTVLHRDGYYARRELGPLDRRTAMVRGRIIGAAEEARVIPDLAPKDLTATQRGSGRSATVTVTMTLDLTRVEFEKRDGQNVATLDVAAFAVAGRRQVGQEWTTLELTYTDSRLAQVRREGLQHTITISVSDRAAEVKIVAYDYGADLVGSAVAKVR